MISLSISIAMCSHNGEKYLQEQLDSIANQSRLPDELIVCDDNSSDRTITILERFSASVDFPVKIIKNKDNIGSTKNFEKAISICEGDIITLADQDDVWMSKKLEVIQGSFEKSRNVGLFFSDANVTDEQITNTKYRLWDCIDFNFWSRIRLVNGNAFEVLLNHNIVTGATMAFRSELKKYILPISTRWVHDGWIAIISSAISDVTIFADPLIEYRQHSQQQIGIENKGIIKEYLESISTKPDGYRLLEEQYVDVYKRLCLYRNDIELDMKIVNVRSKIKHLQARVDITNKENNPLIISLMELFSFRYFFYSRGFRSFFKDCRNIILN